MTNAAYASSTAAAVATTVTTVSAAQPSGLVSGDVLIAWCWANNGASTWTAPGGWTTVQTRADIGSAAFVRAADGTESWPLTFTRGTNSTAAAGVVMVRLTDVVSVESITMTLTSSGTAATLNGVNTTLANALLLQILTNNTTTATTFTPPAGTTLRTTAGATATGSAVPYAIGDDFLTSAMPSGTGTRAWTRNSSQSTRGAVIALNSPPTTGTASGTAALSLNGSGTAATTGTATAALSLSASGASATPAAATAALTFSATGTGAIGTLAAAGTAALTFSASGIAAEAGTGSGTATLSLSGSGDTSAPTSGTAALTFSASGGGGATDGATASLSLSGSGAGSGPAAGTGALTFSAAGAGHPSAAGTATLALSASGTATIPLPIAPPWQPTDMLGTLPWRRRPMLSRRER